jgi:hypothetical protein
LVFNVKEGLERMYQSYLLPSHVEKKRLEKCRRVQSDITSMDESKNNGKAKIVYCKAHEIIHKSTIIPEGKPCPDTLYMISSRVISPFVTSSASGGKYLSKSPSPGPCFDGRSATTG